MHLHLQQSQETNSSESDAKRNKTVETKIQNQGDGLDQGKGTIFSLVSFRQKGYLLGCRKRDLTG